MKDHSEAGGGLVDDLFNELDLRVPPATVLGYVNFSDGRPDPRWQKQIQQALSFLLDRATPRYWEVLGQWLNRGLQALQAGGGSAFRDVIQARAVLESFAQVLPAYRRHHSDLLAHQSEEDLFQPFFLVRALEAVLAERAASGNGPPSVENVLTRLNDFVGYRPIAILETRPRGEPYPHERHRPVPVYLRGVGAARGRYQAVIGKALEILSDTDADLLNAAHLDLDLLDELAMDMRAYDHGHPVNRRPNYVFGEWDPHHIDNKGHYRRYVARQITLDGLLSRLEQSSSLSSSLGGAGKVRELDREELLFEAAAVLAGTILMATGISGWGPSAHSSTSTLAVLMPGIARYRDQFYVQLMRRLTAGHAERLKQDQELTRQPFGGARQHLNAYLARHRAAQLQQRSLALLFAEMGYPQASRAEARRIPTASVRFLSEILSRLSTGHHEAEHGRTEEAARVLPDIEELLQRGITCGALADPWNILGFQGLFPLSPAQEDSLRDPRLDEFVQVMEQIFHLYARLRSEASAAGDTRLAETLGSGLRKVATWWDQYASIEVSDVRRVHGAEAADSADHVATALGRWHERGEATADLAFWRQHLDTFRSPKSFALVVDALLRKQDSRAAMALLINWVSQANEVALEEGVYSFHQLSLRWLIGATGVGDPPRADPAMVQKFFDYLEANAEELWHVPRLEPPAVEGAVEEENLYGAAYEDVTWKDSADDDEESSVAGSDSERKQFDLEVEGPRLEHCLRFQATLARLWGVAARAIVAESWFSSGSSMGALTTDAWLNTARQNLERLLALLDNLNNHPIPSPQGTYESLVEYDRRRVFKEQLLYAAIGTSLDMTMAVGALTGAGGREDADVSHLPGWGRQALRLERALFRCDVQAVKDVLTGFVEQFRQEPLLFTTLADGGQPRQILRVRVAQSMLRVLLINLPRLGLLRETFELLRLARSMEQNHPPEGRGVTEFSHYFQTGFTEAIESVVESAAAWGPEFDDAKLVALLERITAPCLTLWVEHSRGVQISSLETLSDENDWNRLREFIKRYGGDLFHARFMTLANLRGVLHRGVESYLDYLRQEADPLRPIRLINDIDRLVPRSDAVHRLELVLRAIAENYEEYKDYNATTSQSDYGENLHVLLDFLRLKVLYERHAWEFKPLVLVHEVLARRGHRTAALLWERSLTRLTGDLARQYLGRLAELERTRGVRLNTISDRLNERFVKPLALDRLRALVEPAIKEAPGGGPTFARLHEELRAYTATPTGVGLDVPAWLRSMEAEVRHVLTTRSTLAVLAEGFYRVARRPFSLDDFKRQLEEWEREPPQA
jgi:hypothetical protein